MATAELASAPANKLLRGAALNDVLQRVRRTDNVTNWYYLARTWLYLAAVIGGAIWFFHWRLENGLSFWWNVPVSMLAILLVGAGQHQLTGLAHEASHHILFKNRLMNDFVSDWFCMFPMFSSTHHYRLQHMAHHQFVNDPIRDPDVSQLKTSGHWLNFPVSKREFIRSLLKQAWIPNLIRYIRIRAKYNSVGTDKNPYLKKGWKPSKIPLLIGLSFIFGMMGVLAGLVALGNTLLLAVVPPALLAAVCLVYQKIPDHLYHQSRVHPVIPSRVMTQLRMTFITVLFTSLAWIQHVTGEWAAAYFLLLWALPIFTSFSLFMILRQQVQHGNGDRGWLTNTRVFLVHPFINFAVFPLGQDFHLPHHMFATVPHYRLRELHEGLMGFEEYRKHAHVVEGYFVPPKHPQEHPTVLDILGPEFAASEFHEVYIDNTVLEADEIDEKDAIVREGQQEAERVRSQRSA